MGVDGMGQIRRAQTVFYSQSGFGNEIGSMSSGDVRSENPAAFSFADQLKNAGQLAHGLCLAR